MIFLLFLAFHVGRSFSDIDIPDNPQLALPEVSVPVNIQPPPIPIQNQNPHDPNCKHDHQGPVVTRGDGLQHLTMHPPHYFPGVYSHIGVYGEQPFYPMLYPNKVHYMYHSDLPTVVNPGLVHSGVVHTVHPGIVHSGIVHPGIIHPPHPHPPPPLVYPGNSPYMLPGCSSLKFRVPTYFLKELIQCENENTTVNWTKIVKFDEFTVGNAILGQTKYPFTLQQESPEFIYIESGAQHLKDLVDAFSELRLRYQNDTCGRVPEPIAPPSDDLLARWPDVQDKINIGEWTRVFTKLNLEVYINPTTDEGLAVEENIWTRIFQNDWNSAWLTAKDEHMRPLNADGWKLIRDPRDVRTWLNILLVDGTPIAPADWPRLMDELLKEDWRNLLDTKNRPNRWKLVYIEEGKVTWVNVQDNGPPLPPGEMQIWLSAVNREGEPVNPNGWQKVVDTRGHTFWVNAVHEIDKSPVNSYQWRKVKNIGGSDEWEVAHSITGEPFHLTQWGKIVHKEGFEYYIQGITATGLPVNAQRLWQEIVDESVDIRWLNAYDINDVQINPKGWQIIAPAFGPPYYLGSVGEDGIPIHADKWNYIVDKVGNQYWVNRVDENGEGISNPALYEDIPKDIEGDFLPPDNSIMPDNPWQDFFDGLEKGGLSEPVDDDDLDSFSSLEPVVNPKDMEDILKEEEDADKMVDPFGHPVYILDPNDNVVKIPPRIEGAWNDREIEIIRRRYGVVVMTPTGKWNSTAVIVDLATHNIVLIPEHPDGRLWPNKYLARIINRYGKIYLRPGENFQDGEITFDSKTKDIIRVPRHPMHHSWNMDEMEVIVKFYAQILLRPGDSYSDYAVFISSDGRIIKIPNKPDGTHWSLTEMSHVARSFGRTLLTPGDYWNSSVGFKVLNDYNQYMIVPHHPLGLEWTQTELLKLRKYYGVLAPESKTELPRKPDGKTNEEYLLMLKENGYGTYEFNEKGELVKILLDQWIKREVPKKSQLPPQSYEVAGRPNPFGNQQSNPNQFNSGNQMGNAFQPPPPPVVPPFQNQGPNTPFQDQGQNPPFQNQGPNPPFQNQGPNPPFQNQGPNPPFQNQGPTPPFQNQGPNPPFQPPVQPYKPPSYQSPGQYGNQPQGQPQNFGQPNYNPQGNMFGGGYNPNYKSSTNNKFQWQGKDDKTAE